MDGSEDSWNNDTSSSVTRTMQTTTDTPPTVDKVAVSATPIRNASTNSATEVSKKDLGMRRSFVQLLKEIPHFFLTYVQNSRWILFKCWHNPDRPNYNSRPYHRWNHHFSCFASSKAEEGGRTGQD